MYIRKACHEDIDRMMEIYAYARRFMVENGNPKQWAATNRPPQSLVEQDIAAERSYVCIEEARIVGVFVLMQGKRVDPTYDVIYEGAWTSPDTYGVVHRIASDRSVPGIGSFCMAWAYEQCGNIRIDTHGDNLPMQGMLKKLGYRYCGIIYVVEDQDPRLAYEKYEGMNQ